MVCHRAGAGRDHDARGLSACASPGLGRRRGGQVAACNRVDGYGGQHAPRVSTVGDFGANPPVVCELFGYAGRFLQRAPPPRCPVFDAACDRLVRVGRDKRAHVPAAIEKPAQRETGGHDRSFDGRNLVTGSRKLPRIWAMLAGERGWSSGSSSPSTRRGGARRTPCWCRACAGTRRRGRTDPCRGGRAESPYPRESTTVRCRPARRRAAGEPR